MNEQQKHLVEMLNDMYHSQGKEYKSFYRNNYFELLQYIISPHAYSSGGKIIELVSSEPRWFEGIIK